jgi:hypothetical protein
LAAFFLAQVALNFFRRAALAAGRTHNLRAVLEPAFDLAFYEERPAGPSEQRAVAVKLLARQKA